MIWPRHIELIKYKFKHVEDLLLIFLYKGYVFGVVSTHIPELRLPQVTVEEMERVLATQNGESNLEGLLAARCIFTPDKAAEIKVTDVLKDDSFYESIITKDEIRKMIREEMDEMEQIVEVAKSPPPLPSPPSAPPTPIKPKPGKQLSILDKISEQLTGGE